MAELENSLNSALRMKTTVKTMALWLILVTLFVFIPSCNAVRCYACNSDISPNCGSVRSVTCIGKACDKYKYEEAGRTIVRRGCLGKDSLSHSCYRLSNTSYHCSCNTNYCNGDVPNGVEKPVPSPGTIICYACNSDISPNCGSVGSVICIGKTCDKYKYEEAGQTIIRRGCDISDSSTHSCYRLSNTSYHCSCNTNYCNGDVQDGDGTGGGFGTDVGGTGGFDTGGFDTGGFDTDTGGFDTGGFDTGGFNTGGFDTGGFDTGGFDTGGFDTGGFDTGGFGTGGGGNGPNGVAMTSVGHVIIVVSLLINIISVHLLENTP